MRRFSAGETVLLREVHEGRVWTARPGIVVDDRPDLLATYIPAGTMWKVPAADRADMLYPAQERLDADRPRVAPRTSAAGTSTSRTRFGAPHSALTSSTSTSMS